jgi:four helix bundle protein
MKHNFRELQIWQDGMSNATRTYLACRNFPKEELFGLTSQMKRAAVSIPSNIAEGCGRGTDAQVIHFLDIALGSSCELETQVYIAQNLGFMASNDTDSWAAELQSLQRRIRAFRDKLSSNHH